jgi:hypothetical protein
MKHRERVRERETFTYQANPGVTESDYSLDRRPKQIFLVQINAGLS